MSLAGLKKQINKANQYVSEKVGGADSTKLDEDYYEMEKKIDVTKSAVDDVMSKTIEFLQPNPAARAKLSAMHSMSKMKSTYKNARYTQPEGTLGESMLKYGKDLGEDSNFGLALNDSGETMKQLAEVRDAFDLNVRQNFLDPLEQLKSRDLKEILHHRKKVESRRLDFDCKRRKKDKGGGSKISEEEIKQAEEKFEESRDLAESGMINLLETSDVEQVSQLLALTEAQLDYHRQCIGVLENLSDTLKERIDDAHNNPKPRRQSKKVSNPIYGDFSSTNSDEKDNGYTSMEPSVPVYSAQPGGQEPSCKALYDFEPENEGELAFSEGDVITLTNRLDANWLEGTVHGKSGFFPTNYVEVLVDI